MIFSGLSWETPVVGRIFSEECWHCLCDGCLGDPALLQGGLADIFAATKQPTSMQSGCMCMYDSYFGVVFYCFQFYMGIHNRLHLMFEVLLRCIHMVLKYFYFYFWCRHKDFPFSHLWLFSVGENEAHKAIVFWMYSSKGDKCYIFYKNIEWSMVWEDFRQSFCGASSRQCMWQWYMSICQCSAWIRKLTNYGISATAFFVQVVLG